MKLKVSLREVEFLYTALLYFYRGTVSMNEDDGKRILQLLQYLEMTKWRKECETPNL
jgi:hypothetical protein